MSLKNKLHVSYKNDLLRVATYKLGFICHYKRTFAAAQHETHIYISQS